MHARRGVRLLVILASWCCLASCRQAPVVRSSPSSQASRSPTAAPASQSAEEAPTNAVPEWKIGFTHYVTQETALLRRASDGDVIYDTISRGSRVRMLDGLDPNALDPNARLAERQSYVHVRTEDGRDGLIIPGRLKALLMPVPQIAHPAFMARVVHPTSRQLANAPAAVFSAWPHPFDSAAAPPSRKQRKTLSRCNDRAAVGRRGLNWGRTETPR